MLIFSPHNSNLCLESQETRFLWNIFEAVQETRSTCFMRIKTLGYASCFYTPIKHCCSFFKHYFKNGIWIARSKHHVTWTRDVSLCVRDSSTSSSSASIISLLEILDKFLDGRFTLKFSLINLCIVKAGERVVPPKAIVFLLTVLHCLMLFNMADKISMIPEVMSQRYLNSAIYPSQCSVEKTTEIDCILWPAGPR